MPKLCPITKAKQHLLELARRTQELGESYILLKDGEPISALLPIDEYESMLETLDILATEPNIVRTLKRTEREIAAGKYTVWKPESAPRTRATRARAPQPSPRTTRRRKNAASAPAHRAKIF